MSVGRRAALFLLVLSVGVAACAVRHNFGFPRDAGPAAVLRAVLRATQASRSPAPSVALSCGRLDGARLTRAMSMAGLEVQVADRPGDWLASLEAARDQPANVLLDASCAQAPQLLAQADKLDLFRARHRRWLLFNLGRDGRDPHAGNGSEAAAEDYRLEVGVPRGPVLDSCYRRVARLLADLAVLVDSDVSAVCTEATGPTPRPAVAEAAEAAEAADPVAVSAFRAGRGAPLRLQLAARWRSGVARRVDARPVVVRRLDLSGYVLNVGFVVFNRKALRVNILEGRLSSDFFANFAWDMMHDMARMLNSTINVTLTNSFGYTEPGSTPTEGLMGLQMREEVEVVGTGYTMILDPNRLRVTDFTNFYCPGRGVFAFRAPPVSSEHNVFALPFPLSLWEASAGMVAACTLLLVVVLRADGRHRNQDGDDHVLHSSSDAVLLAVAAICQQGSPVETRGVPGRIIVFLLFLLVLLLHTCYSASIVVLLQSTSTNIRHYRDMLHSDITVGAINVSYVTYYLSTESDPVRYAVFWNKIMGRGRKNAKPNLLTHAEGVSRVKRDFFAFYGIESNIYEEIGRTWQEHEKCGLVTMGTDFLRIRDPHIGVTKTSHNTEAIKIMLRRLTERGIWQRMRTKHLRAKPVCTNTAAVFNSVSLTDTRGAFYVLLAVMAASVAMLLVELAVHRATRRRKERAAEAVAVRPVAYGSFGGDGPAATTELPFEIRA